MRIQDERLHPEKRVIRRYTELHISGGEIMRASEEERGKRISFPMGDGGGYIRSIASGGHVPGLHQRGHHGNDVAGVPCCARKHISSAI